MAQYVALLRGINVGRANRITMAELRAIFANLGCTSVRTVLQSGNVVFSAPDPAKSAEEPPVDGVGSGRIESEILRSTGVSCCVVVVSAAGFRAVLDENPLADAADQSKMLISFCAVAPRADAIARPSDEQLAPERLIVGTQAIYQWLPAGVMGSNLPPRFFDSLGVMCTARNLRTAERIRSILDE